MGSQKGALETPSPGTENFSQEFLKIFDLFDQLENKSLEEKKSIVQNVEAVLKDREFSHQEQQILKSQIDDLGKNHPELKERIQKLKLTLAQQVKPLEGKDWKDKLSRTVDWVSLVSPTAGAIKTGFEAVEDRIDGIDSAEGLGKNLPNVYQEIVKAIKSWMGFFVGLMPGLMQQLPPKWRAELAGMMEEEVESDGIISSDDEITQKLEQKKKDLEQKKEGKIDENARTLKDLQDIRVAEDGFPRIAFKTKENGKERVWQMSFDGSSLWEKERLKWGKIEDSKMPIIAYLKNNQENLDAILRDFSISDAEPHIKTAITVVLLLEQQKELKEKERTSSSAIDIMALLAKYGVNLKKETVKPWQDLIKNPEKYIAEARKHDMNPEEDFLSFQNQKNKELIDLESTLLTQVPDFDSVKKKISELMFAIRSQIANAPDKKSCLEILIREIENAMKEYGKYAGEGPKKTLTGAKDRFKKELDDLTPLTA